MNTILTDIASTINDDYDGTLCTAQQRADLSVYKDGEESSIRYVTPKAIVFEDGAIVKLIDADIAWLSYLKQTI